MLYLKVVLTTILSVVLLFAITRLIGYRQLSELSLFDYINGITIGSIAAELATCEQGETLQISIAMVIYGIFSILVAFLTDKSTKLRKLFVGNPTLLMKNGRLYYEGFRKSRLDVNEFLMKCRNNGYFDITQIDTAILEPNGRVSFLPVSQNRPVTPKDMIKRDSGAECRKGSWPGRIPGKEVLLFPNISAHGEHPFPCG